MWIAALITLAPQAVASDTPLYSSSVVGTEFDFIRTTDPHVFQELKNIGLGKCEMPDKRDNKGELMQNAYQFTASYKDGASIHIAVHASIGSEDKAKAEALRFVEPIGRIPSVLRKGVNRLVVNVGDETAFSDQGLIVAYTQNATKRIQTHDLEETMFHESVHATWDKTYAGSPEWKAAQEKDGAFLTNYGKNNPTREDLAESALFAVTLVHHPDRIPAVDAAKIKKLIPARIAFVEKLFPKTASWHVLSP